MDAFIYLFTWNFWFSSFTYYIHNGMWKNMIILDVRNIFINKLALPSQTNYLHLNDAYYAILNRQYGTCNILQVVCKSESGKSMCFESLVLLNSPRV